MFEKALKECRKRKGYTQYELAELVGVSQSAIAQFELGSSLPNIKTAVRLAETLGVTCEELVKGKEQAQ